LVDEDEEAEEEIASLSLNQEEEDMLAMEFYYRNMAPLQTT
jgi:hypothetical protein